MKRILNLLRNLGGASVFAVCLFALSSSPAAAFQPFTTNGAMTTGSGGGGSGSVGTLQQVLDAGNTATQNMILTGDATTTKFEATSNIFVPINGVASAPSYSFRGDEDTGINRIGANSMAFVAGAGNRFIVNASNLQAAVNLVSFTDGGSSLGTSANRFLNGWFTGVVTSSRMETTAAAGSVGLSMLTDSIIQLQRESNRGLIRSNDSTGMSFQYLASGAQIIVSGTNTELYSNTAGIRLTGTSLVPITASLATSLGTNAAPWAGVYASSTVGSTLPSMTVTGTILLPAAHAGNSAVLFSSETGGTERAGINLSNFGNLNFGWMVGNRSINIMNNGSGIFSFTGTSNPVLTAAAHNTADFGTTLNYFRQAYITTVSSSNAIVANASSTFFLSGASALVSTVAPIPTSTSFMAGTIPNQLYLFNATNTNCVYWTPGQLRGSWNAGTITPIVTWIPAATGTGAVVWRFAAQSLADNTYVGTPFGGPFSYATSTAGNNLTRQIDNMDLMSVESAASGVPIRFEACRIGGQAGDTFGGDAYLELISGEYRTPNVSD